jgi:hypothetical protein
MAANLQEPDLPDQAERMQALARHPAEVSTNSAAQASLAPWLLAGP